MPTKSINTSATGPSWDRATWRKKVLLDLRADDDVVIPAYFFGTALMAKLARDGVFERGFPPETGDFIVLDIDGESSDFGVHPVRGELVCYENREANPRTLRFSVEELTLHTLRRMAFYTLMARDLEISGQATELQRGIWELGRKKLPGWDPATVFFIEEGVRETDLILCLMRKGVNVHCLLFHGELPRPLVLPPKTIAQSLLDVYAGCFVSDIFEVLAACEKPSCAEKHVSNYDLSRQMESGFDGIKKERILDVVNSQQLRQEIAETSGSADEFLTKLISGFGSDSEMAKLFMLLRAEDKPGKLLSLAQIGQRLGIGKQAVSKRCKKMANNFPLAHNHIKALRTKVKTVKFSEMAPSERRKKGVDGAYNYDAG